MKALRHIPRSRLPYSVPKDSFESIYMVTSIEVAKLWRLCYTNTIKHKNIGLRGRKEDKLFKNIYAGGMTPDVKAVGKTEMGMVIERSDENPQTQGFSFKLKQVLFITDPTTKTIYLHVPTKAAFTRINKAAGKEKQKDFQVPPLPFKLPDHMPFL